MSRAAGECLPADVVIGIEVRRRVPVSGGSRMHAPQIGERFKYTDPGFVTLFREHCGGVAQASRE